MSKDSSNSTNDKMHTFVTGIETTQSVWFFVSGGLVALSVQFLLSPETPAVTFALMGIVATIASLSLLATCGVILSAKCFPEGVDVLRSGFLGTLVAITMIAPILNALLFVITLNTLNFPNLLEMPTTAPEEVGAIEFYFQLPDAEDLKFTVH